jgi:hypothetical protein
LTPLHSFQVFFALLLLVISTDTSTRTCICIIPVSIILDLILSLSPFRLMFKRKHTHPAHLATPKIPSVNLPSHDTPDIPIDFPRLSTSSRRRGEDERSVFSPLLRDGATPSPEKGGGGRFKLPLKGILKNSKKNGAPPPSNGYYSDSHAMRTSAPSRSSSRTESSSGSYDRPFTPVIQSAYRGRSSSYAQAPVPEIVAPRPKPAMPSRGWGSAPGIPSQLAVYSNSRTPSTPYDDPPDLKKVQAKLGIVASDYVSPSSHEVHSKHRHRTSSMDQRAPSSKPHLQHTSRKSSYAGSTDPRHVGAGPPHEAPMKKHGYQHPDAAPPGPIPIPMERTRSYSMEYKKPVLAATAPVISHTYSRPHHRKSSSSSSLDKHSDKHFSSYDKKPAVYRSLTPTVQSQSLGVTYNIGLPVLTYNNAHPIYATGSCNRHVLEHPIVADHNTRGPLEEMTIQCILPRSPSNVRGQEAVPWLVHVRRREGIRIVDLFEEVYQTFNQLLTREERDTIQGHDIGLCNRAFEERCKEALGPYLPLVETRKGWRRVDALKGCNHFRGLTWDPAKSRWIMYLVTKENVQPRPLAR